MTSAEHTTHLIQGKWLQIQIKRALVQNNLPCSSAAIALLSMIAAHESGGFTYNKQIQGPALSIYQIEPATYDDVCAYAMEKDYLKGELPNPPERLIFDLDFATCIARIFFLRFKERIPSRDNIEGLANYAKKYWNTDKGKARPEYYSRAYLKYWA